MGGRLVIGLDYPYPVVDAAFAEWTEHATSEHSLEDLRVRRVGITSGSTRYVIQHGKQTIGEFKFRATGANGLKTHLAISIQDTGDVEQDRAWLNYFGYMMREFLRWFELDQVITQIGTTKDLPEQRQMRPTDKLPNPKRRGGPPTKDYNDRAFERLAAGEPRDVVYLDWLKDQGEDPDDRDIQAAKRDAFRKAMDRRSVKKNTAKGRTDET